MVILEDLGAGIKISAPALTLRTGIDGQVCSQIVDDAAGDEYFALGRLEVAVRQLGLPMKLLRRILGDDLNQATGRIAAKQRPLRAFEHLDVIDVRKVVESWRDGGRVVDTIQVEGHRQFDSGPNTCTADATQVDERKADRVADAQSGYDLSEVEE